MRELRGSSGHLPSRSANAERACVDVSQAATKKAAQKACSFLLPRWRTATTFRCKCNKGRANTPGTKTARCGGEGAWYGRARLFLKLFSEATQNTFRNSSSSARFRRGMEERVAFREPRRVLPEQRRCCARMTRRKPAARSFSPNAQRVHGAREKRFHDFSKVAWCGACV